MFNLIMTGQEWDGDRITISLPRLFEYTEEDVANKFRRDGNPDFASLARLPCLFMNEGTENEIARVGMLVRTRIVGRDVVLEYTFDEAVPPILNSSIFLNKLEFEMPYDWEFSRNHWAVKDVDLYRVLFRLVKPGRQRPIVFALPEHEQIELELVSAMMPFSAEFAEVYATIRQAAAEVGLVSRRADDMWEAPNIMQDIASLIDRSRVVVCDCTGRNPNVFYEAGIAHTLGREVILITQNDADIPFDLRHLRYIQYLNNAEGRRTLADALGRRLNVIINGVAR